jgi:hypothetical protein
VALGRDHPPVKLATKSTGLPGEFKPKMAKIVPLPDAVVDGIRRAGTEKILPVAVSA